ELPSTKTVFTKGDWEAADAASKELAQGRKPESATTAARLVAAARRRYDDDPEGFAQKRCCVRVMRQAAALLSPGTRAGEAKVDLDTKQALTKAAEQSGLEAFEEFKRWVGVKSLSSSM